MIMPVGCEMSKDVEGFSGEVGWNIEWDVKKKVNSMSGELFNKEMKCKSASRRRDENICLFDMIE